MEELKKQVEDMFTTSDYEEVNQQEKHDDNNNKDEEKEVKDENSDDDDVTNSSEEDNEEEEEEVVNDESDDSSGDEFEGLLEKKQNDDIEANNNNSNNKTITKKQQKHLNSTNSIVLSKRKKRLMRQKINELLNNSYIKRIISIVFILLGIIGMTYDIIDTTIMEYRSNKISSNNDNNAPTLNINHILDNPGMYAESSSSSSLNDFTWEESATTSAETEFSSPSLPQTTTTTYDDKNTKSNNSNKDNEVTRISILGERHSGTNVLSHVLEQCFPNMEITTSLSRMGTLFQSSTLGLNNNNLVSSSTQQQEEERTNTKNTLVIGIFLNAYDWIELMRNNPIHAPNHENINNWYEFVTKSWTMDRPISDKPLDKIHNDNDNIELSEYYCQFKFRYNEVIPCLKQVHQKDPNLHHNNNPIYELNIDGSGNPYDNILKLREDKIRNILSTQNWEYVTNLQTIHYEDLFTLNNNDDHTSHSFNNLLLSIEKITGHVYDCELLDNTLMLTDNAKVKTNYLGYRDYLNEHVNWDVEELIGYTMKHYDDKDDDEDISSSSTSLVTQVISNPIVDTTKSNAQQVINEDYNSSNQQQQQQTHIAIIGERHSGTKWLYDKISNCYPNIKVTHSYNRPGFLFQGGDAFDNNIPVSGNNNNNNNQRTIIIASFIPPYLWIELMRRSPEYAPHHTDLSWLDFVTTPWVPKDFISPIHSNIIKSCKYNFTSLDIIPCHDDNDNNNDNTFYELKNDHSGYPYNSIVELRSDKIKDFLSLGNKNDNNIVIPVRNECFMDNTNRFNQLLYRLSKELDGIPSQCSSNTNEFNNDNDKYDFLNLMHYMEVEIGLHSSCSVDDLPKYEIREGYEDYKHWLNKHLDWDTENLIGYYKPDDEVMTTTTTAKTKNDNINDNQISTTATTTTKITDNSNEQIIDHSATTLFTTIDHLPLDSKKKGPKLAWLLTYPNTSTLYTIKLITKASNTISVTNYGTEYVSSDNYESMPLYKDVPGPYLFYGSKTGTHDINDSRVPNSYILTQTHCGSRCYNCPPNEYIESVDKFLIECLQAPRVLSPNKVKDQKDTVKMEVAPDVHQVIVEDSYSLDLVKKIIHVIKDPFDTIVSGFHHEYKSLLHKYSIGEIESFDYSYDAEGFQKYCKEQDEKFADEEHILYGHLYGVEIYSLTMNVPCHAHFYRYVQWHNLAFQLEGELNLPTYILNYEDYNDNDDGGEMLEAKVKEMLYFLELPLVDNDFEHYKFDGSHDHYTKEEAVAISAFIEVIANDQTWSYICRYLPGAC